MEEAEAYINTTFIFFIQPILKVKKLGKKILKTFRFGHLCIKRFETELCKFGESARILLYFVEYFSLIIEMLKIL